MGRYRMIDEMDMKLIQATVDLFYNRFEMMTERLDHIIHLLEQIRDSDKPD
jgi:hypothetical protein